MVTAASLRIISMMVSPKIASYSVQILEKIEGCIKIKRGAKPRLEKTEKLS